MKKTRYSGLALLAGLTLTTSALAQGTLVNFEGMPDGINGTQNAVGFNVQNVGGATDSFRTVVAPGSWGLLGTAGTEFMGVWGDWSAANAHGSYTGAGDMTYGSIFFTQPSSLTPMAVNVTLDLLNASAWGNRSGSVTIYGFNNGTQVSALTPTFGLTTVDTTSEYVANVSLMGVDEIRYATTTPMGLDNINFTPSAVPEPSTFALVGMDLSATLIFRRRVGGRARTSQ
jgi:hypothetical protein